MCATLRISRQAIRIEMHHSTILVVSCLLQGNKCDKSVESEAVENAKAALTSWRLARNMLVACGSGSISGSPVHDWLWCVSKTCRDRGGWSTLSHRNVERVDNVKWDQALLEDWLGNFDTCMLKVTLPQWNRQLCAKVAVHVNLGKRSSCLDSCLESSFCQAVEVCSHTTGGISLIVTTLFHSPSPHHYERKRLSSMRVHPHASGDAAFPNWNIPLPCWAPLRLHPSLCYQTSRPSPRRCSNSCLRLYFNATIHLSVSLCPAVAEESRCSEETALTSSSDRRSGLQVGFGLIGFGDSLVKQTAA
ncbi:hypothetical protein TcWFU_003220 [Taenia crassiceps]|uniref:Uncharacterized protein n=1 Tax=Taenia crassiceps TaxID=6207 RepID=A0ABR4Q086_9CEST